jgi:hypothetical protein
MGHDDDFPTTEELRAVQVEKAGEEREQAREAEKPAAERAHGRRAEKAAYLAEKLDEQARALDE